MIIPR